MRAVLTALKGRGLFFVDSVTTPRTVGMRLTRELDMRGGRRSVFLDNEQDGSVHPGTARPGGAAGQKNGRGDRHLPSPSRHDTYP